MIVIDVPTILYNSYVTLFIHRYPCPCSIVRENSQNKKEGKDQELIQSSTKHRGYQWESNNVTIRHYKREPRGQPFPKR